MVSGIKEGEPVTLYYSTADGQTVDQPVPMALAPSDWRYRGSLPPGASAQAEIPGGASPAGVPSGTNAITGQIVKGEHEKLGRNEPCWCGSGKKFKVCHGR